MTRQDLVNKSIDKLNTVKEALELIEILEYDESEKIMNTDGHTIDGYNPSSINCCVYSSMTASF